MPAPTTRETARSIQTAIRAATPDERAAGLTVQGFEASIFRTSGVPCMVISAEGNGGRERVEGLANHYADVAGIGAVRVETVADDDFEDGVDSMMWLNLEAVLALAA